MSEDEILARAEQIASETGDGSDESFRRAAIQALREATHGSNPDAFGRINDLYRSDRSKITQPSPDDLREDINPVAGGIASFITGRESTALAGGDIGVGLRKAGEWFADTGLGRAMSDELAKGMTLGRNTEGTLDWVYRNVVPDAMKMTSDERAAEVDSGRAIADQYAQENFWAGRLPRAAGSFEGLIENLALLRKAPGLRGSGPASGAAAFATEQALVPEIQAEARGQQSRPAHFIPIGQEDDSSRLSRMAGRALEGATLDLALRGAGRAAESALGRVPFLGASGRVNAAVGQGAALGGLGYAQAPEGQEWQEAGAMGLLGLGMGATGHRFPARGRPEARERGPLGQRPMNQARKPGIDPNARRQTNPDDFSGDPIGPAGREMMARDRRRAAPRKQLTNSGDPMWDAMVKGDRPAYLLPGEGNRALMSPAERRLALPPPEMLAKAGIQPVKVPGMGTLYVKKSHPLFAGQENIPEFIRAMRQQGREHELMGYTPEAKLDEATHIVTAVGKDGKEIVSVGTKDPVQEASNLENVAGVAETVVRPASPETVAEINAGRLTDAAAEAAQPPAKPESSLRKTKDKTLTSIREKGSVQHIQDRLRELGDESVPTDPNAPRVMATPSRRRPTPARDEPMADPNAPRVMATPPRRRPTPAVEDKPTGERFGQVEIDALKDQGATVKPLKSRPGYDVTMPDGTGALIHTDKAGNVTKVTEYGKGKVQRPKRSKRERGMIDPNAFIDTINKGTDYAIDFFKRLERGVDNLSPFEIRAMLARLPEVRDKAYDHLPDTHWFVSAPEGEVWPRVAGRLTETYDYKAVKAPEVFGSKDAGRSLRDDLAKNAAEEAGGELVAIHDVKSHRDNLTLAITEELDISTGEKYFRVVSVGGKRGEPGIDVNGTMEDFPSLREAREAAKDLDLQRREDLADDIEFSTKGGVSDTFRDDFISDDPKVRRSPRERGMVDPRGVVEAGAKAADIAEKAARDFLRRAKTEIMDPAGSWRADQKAKAKARGKAAEIMAAVGEATGARSTARWLSRKLGLPPSDPIVRNLNDSAQVFRDDVQARINQLHEKSSRLPKDQEREFWYKAEKLEDVPKDHPLHDLLREHHEIVTSEADLLVRAGEEWTSTARMLRERANEKPKGSKERAALLRQAAQLDSAARLSRSRAEFYNQPGERGYVTRVPPRNKAKVKEAAKAFVSRLIRNLRTPGLRGMAASVDKSIKDTLKGRKQLTPEEAEAAGYAVGLVPLMRSWHKAGGVVSTFHTMEYVNTAKEFAPYVRLPEGPKDKSGQWILADGPGWGVLRGKEIHHSLYGMLEVMTPKGRNGIMDLLRAFDAGQKEGATVQRLPGYPVKAALLENPVATWAAGMSPIRFKKQLGDAIPSTIRFLKAGEQDQYMKVIVDAGLAHNSAAMVEVRDTAGSGSDAASTNLRIGSGKGREYLAEFRERFLSHLAERIAAIPEGTQFSLGSKGAELMNTVREAWVNFDYARFAGIDASLKPGVLAREAAGIVDLVWKRALVAELMQTGGGGDLVRTAVRAATGAKHRGLTAIETRTVLRDWFDPSRMAEGVRDVSNFPLAGDFIRFAYMHGRNIAPSSLGGGGYWKRNPLGAAVAIAPAAVITSGFIAYLMSQGMSQEEAEAVVEEGKKQMTGGDEERMQSIAPVMLTEDKDGNPVLYGVPIEQALGIRSFLRSPAKNVVGNPEEGYMGRLLRGVLSTSPTGQVLYEALADRDIYTGGSIRQGDDNTNMLEMMKGSGLPVATVQQWSRRAAKRKRAEELGLDPDVYAGTTGETLFRSLMGVGLKAGHDPKSPAGREQMGFRKFLERQERLLDASKEGGRFSPEMRRPEPIRPDDSTDERARKQRLWQTYFRENPRLLRQILGQ